MLSSLASRSTQSPRPPRTTQAAATHRTRRGPPCQKSTPCPGSTGDSDSLPDGYPVPVGPTALEDGAACSRSLAEPPPPPAPAERWPNCRSPTIAASRLSRTRRHCRPSSLVVVDDTGFRPKNLHESRSQASSSLMIQDRQPRPSGRRHRKNLSHVLQCAQHPQRLGALCPAFQGARRVNAPS